jgi:hypothetical protein
VRPYFRIVPCAGGAESEPPIYGRDEIEQLALEAARRSPGKSFEVALVLSIASAPVPEASMFWMDGVQPAPPDDPEHNPDGLTPDQVGVADGWRLLRRSEVRARRELVEVQRWLDAEWCGGTWMASVLHGTYRTRLPYGELDKEGKE